ncbi:hypothetical protein, partial [Serratia marcescens]|uniref:hypothetical protein n=1 Tax=Serratia marcescens TaxID=615 RepID=UPI0040466831
MPIALSTRCPRNGCNGSLLTLALEDGSYDNACIACNRVASRIPSPQEQHNAAIVAEAAATRGVKFPRK